MTALRHALPVLGAIALLAACNFAGARSKPVPLPDPKLDAPRSAKPAEQVAVFAGGCFWGVEAVFEHVKGVKDAVSGYAGGSALTARYPIVAGGRTGHAESVRVVYDPAQVSYGQLLKVYFSVAHDPTQLNRQSPDVGPQYRSGIFTTSPGQAKIASMNTAPEKSAGSESPSRVTGRDTRATKGSLARMPTVKTKRPPIRTGNPHADGARARARISSRRAQTRYAAMKGIAKPCERLGNSDHSCTRPGTRGA